MFVNIIKRVRSIFKYCKHFLTKIWYLTKLNLKITFKEPKESPDVTLQLALGM